MKEKTVVELKQMIDNNDEFQLIDVRESHEFDQANLDGKLIPLGNILNQTNDIRTDVPVVIHCRSGARSAVAIHQLESTHGFTNLYNLKGGIIAYAKEIDQSLVVE
ncbi:MAG TPA: rhodanese-like domain-containing protein [Bacteroidia bacterium]|nr:rhodanese-like domain-containing protein [Bacteroidia bacterium]HNT80846.1 rhodanese-like domain-containing protein [Bacteroidia bacterium]